MSDLTQDESAEIMLQSMQNVEGEMHGLYGWTWPVLSGQLILAHRELTGNDEDCVWTARHDIMRYVCQHGHTVKLLGIHVLVGSNRN